MQLSVLYTFVCFAQETAIETALFAMATALMYNFLPLTLPIGHIEMPIAACRSKHCYQDTGAGSIRHMGLQPTQC